MTPCRWCKRLGFKRHRAVEERLMMAAYTWAENASIRNWRRVEKAVEAYCPRRKR